MQSPLQERKRKRQLRKQRPVYREPVLDKRVRAGLGTKVEIRDVQGKLEHAAKITDLELGYDKRVEPGKFYLLPSIGSHYYCERSENDLVPYPAIH